MDKSTESEGQSKQAGNDSKKASSGGTCNRSSNKDERHWQGNGAGSSATEAATGGNSNEESNYTTITEQKATTTTKDTPVSRGEEGGNDTEEGISVYSRAARGRTAQ